MKSSFIILTVLAAIVVGYPMMPLADAQFSGGGVNKEGTWYVGEGLNVGDQFSYKLCHVNYKECAPFRMDMWFEGKKTVGTEEKWVVQTVVYDGNKIVKGTMELGTIAPEPTGGSHEIGPYRSAFKTSIVWLSAFATSDSGAGEGPKAWKAPSWGKIGNIGGEQIIPTSLETIKVPAGTYDTVLVTWKTGGYLSKVWAVDEFPFPVKALSYTHVAEGVPPKEYEFELLSYKQNIQSDPFVNVKSTPEVAEALGCPKFYDLVDIKKPTKKFDYLLEIKYGPEKPMQGCPIEWFINFKSKFQQEEFLYQVQYDILVVDDKFSIPPLRSVAADEGRPFLYSPSGQVKMSTIVEEDVGTAHYVFYIYGLGPETIVPSTAPDYLQIDIPILPKDGTTVTPTVKIPDWIKNNAGWWADGQIDDSSFVQGIQWLIKEGIMKIPPTSQGNGSGTNEIPSWIKNNAGWWADGQIDDSSFVQGIQWLIKEGIMKITS